MRNSLVGIALAVVLVAALFAAARFGSHPAAQQPASAQSADPAQTVAALTPDFIGQRKVGDWQLTCNKPRTLPKRPQMGNSEGTAPKEAPPPADWKLPHCNVSQALKNPKNPADEVRMTLRRMGFQGVLAIFVRLPVESVEIGDVATLHADTTDIPLAIRTCSVRFCLAVVSIKHVDEPGLLKTKSMKLTFAAHGANKEIEVPFRMNGFEQAVGAMRRMDK